MVFHVEVTQGDDHPNFVLICNALVEDATSFISNILDIEHDIMTLLSSDDNLKCPYKLFACMVQVGRLHKHSLEIIRLKNGKMHVFSGYSIHEGCFVSTLKDVEEYNGMADISEALAKNLKRLRKL